MLPPWLPNYKQCYPHGCRIINNVTPMAAGIKTMLSPWLPDYKQCYPHGYRIVNNVTTMATGLKEMIHPPMAAGI